ncbi:MAG: hypothetical protein LBK67_10100 [Coriobacteriales bacterium]|jgi:hypothetical protein|nr:hypothetical protein [Coriobacteriales bacterium]
MAPISPVMTRHQMRPQSLDPADAYFQRMPFAMKPGETAHLVDRLPRHLYAVMP